MEPRGKSRLVEKSFAKYKLLHPFSWGKLEETAAFLPRVRFQRTILSPAQWNCNSTHFRNKSKEKIISNFKLWAQDWGLPQRFLLVKYVFIEINGWGGIILKSSTFSMLFISAVYLFKLTPDAQQILYTLKKKFKRKT